MVDHKDMAAAAAPAPEAPLRDDDGALRPEFVARVAEAVEAGDVGGPYAAGRRTARSRRRRPDRGARPRPAPAAHRTDGRRLRLHRADRGRRHGARGHPRGAAGRDRRRGRPRARFRRRRLHPRGPRPRRIRTRSSSSFRPIERVALARSLLYPEDSAGRRMQTEFIAVPPSWTVGQTIDYMRETDGPAGALLRNLRRRSDQQIPRRGAARPAAAHQAAGADRPN